jgi:hypothetical protein
MVNQDRSQDPQYMNKLQAKGQTVTLAAQMKSAEMLPTPGANSAMAVDLQTQKDRPDLQPNLETVMARMLPTPTVNDSKNSSLPPSQADRDGLAGAMLRDNSIPTGVATYLNPSFVEEMMGFPVGWTV